MAHHTYSSLGLKVSNMCSSKMKIFWPNGPSEERKGTKCPHLLVKINIDKKETKQYITLSGNINFLVDINVSIQNLIF